MTLIDKVTYIQRLLYTVEKEHIRIAKTTNDDSLKWRLNYIKDETERHVDESIECLHYWLEIVGYFPEFRELTYGREKP